MLAPKILCLFQGEQRLKFFNLVKKLKLTKRLKLNCVIRLKWCITQPLPGWVGLPVQIQAKVPSWRPRKLLQVSPNNPARFHPISRHFFSSYGNCCLFVEIIICLREVSKNGMENKYCGRVVDTCMDRFGSVSLQRK